MACMVMKPLMIILLCQKALGDIGAQQRYWGGGNPQSSPRKYSNVIEEEMISMVRAGNEFG